MNKLFLISTCLFSLNLPTLASDLPTLDSLETALATTHATSQELDPTNQLMDAVEVQDIKKAQIALEHGARGEDIPLLFPANTNDTEILKLLTQYRLTKKLSLDQQTEIGESSLYLACLHGNAEGAEFLLHAGASPFLTIKNTDFFHTKRDTALNIACKKCPRSTVELLLRKGGHRLINTTNEHGRSCLHDYCRGEINLDMLQLLLRHGGDVNLQDKDGNTPFHYACSAKKDKSAQMKALNLLMEYGVDATILNHRGKQAYPCGLLLDITNKRALDDASPEAIQIMIQSKKSAAAAASAPAPTVTQRALQILCSICMGDEEDKDAKNHIVIACNHGYHRDCLTPWLAHNPSCPLCRSTDLTEKK
jgi:ankyrin repeat protein